VTGRYHTVIGACAAVIATAPFYPSGVGFPVIIAALGALGGLVPDIDDPYSTLGRCLPIPSCQSQNGMRHGRTLFGHQVWHRDQFHSLGMGLFFAMPVAVILGLVPAVALLAGFLSHLVCDYINPTPMMLLWPFSTQRHRASAPAMCSDSPLFIPIEMGVTAAAVYLAMHILTLV